MSVKPKVLIVGKSIWLSDHTDVTTRPNLAGNRPPTDLGPEIIIHKSMWGQTLVWVLWDWHGPPKTEPLKKKSLQKTFVTHQVIKWTHRHTHTQGGHFLLLGFRGAILLFLPTLSGIYFRLSSAQASIHHKTAHPLKQCSMTHTFTLVNVCGDNLINWCH